MNVLDIEKLSKATLQRYQLIEIIAYWEGRFTTNHLIKGFGIGRQQASRDINTYIREIAPENLEYDLQLRGYKPTESFVPVVTQGHVDEYLNLLTFNQALVTKSNYNTMGLRSVYSVMPPPRSIKPQTMRGIVKAITEQRRVEVEYISLENPEPEIRVIAPHSLVETPLRWHVRAYCEKNRDYRDFVLSRFTDEPDLMDVSPNPKEEDKAWQQEVNIVLEPAQHLSDAQKQLVIQDFGMANGELVLPTRLSLVFYMLRALGLSLDNPDKDELICVKNTQELKQALNL